MNELAIDRLNKEFIDLTEKIEKLHDFIWLNDIFDSLSKEYKHLLIEQLHVMRSYWTILEKRLKLIKKG